MKELNIDGIIYVPKESVCLPSTDYVIVRTYSAGVFAGYIESRSSDGKQVIMRNVRCLWFWDGAATLFQLSSDGTCKPDKCKFTKIVDKVELSEVIQVLYCSDKASKQIKAVSEWVIK